MGKQDSVASQIQQMCEIFRTCCEDATTLDEIAQVAGDRGRWGRAHDLFDKIRRKSLKAVGRGNTAVTVQYEFEEVCAKAIHNLGALPAPFDSDSIYWVIPRALRLARCLGIPDSRVLEIATEPGPPGGHSLRSCP